MTKLDIARPAGRPKSAGKRTAITEAARRLFAANSYDSVTMDQVARAAGVAKMTVYGHFSDKESLFEAIVRSTSDLMTAALPPLPLSDGDLEEELVTFGQTFLTVVLSPGIVNSFHRHVDMLARDPALAARFYHAGPGRTRATLGAYLRSAAAQAHPQIDIGTEAASDLMSLWLGDMQLLLALGLVTPLSPEDIAQRVRRCTRLFLQAYGLPGLATAAK
jgi:TetR/AcrR family transcriptional repressor of mexJK operon